MLGERAQVQLTELIHAARTDEWRRPGSQEIDGGCEGRFTGGFVLRNSPIRTFQFEVEGCIRGRGIEDEVWKNERLCAGKAILEDTPQELLGLTLVSVAGANHQCGAFLQASIEREQARRR